MIEKWWTQGSCKQFCQKVFLISSAMQLDTFTMQMLKKLFTIVNRSQHQQEIKFNSDVMRAKKTSSYLTYFKIIEVVSGKIGYKVYKVLEVFTPGSDFSLGGSVFVPLSWQAMKQPQQLRSLQSAQPRPFLIIPSRSRCLCNFPLVASLVASVASTIIEIYNWVCNGVAMSALFCIYAPICVHKRH